MCIRDRLCDHCKVVSEKSACNALPEGVVQHYTANGCSVCDHQGYHGRAAIAEVLQITDELESYFLEKATPMELLSAAIAGGFEKVSADAIEKINQGVTSVEEVCRVVDLKRQ